MRTLVRDRTSGEGVRWERIASLVGRLRQALAKASVNALEPDLVILDEFQKFRELLADPNTSEAAELAHAMFSHESARVLLLSATPYSPFTRSDDAETTTTRTSSKRRASSPGGTRSPSGPSRQRWSTTAQHWSAVATLTSPQNPSEPRCFRS